MGTFIEGGARWGFDPIWKEVKDDESDDSDEEIAEPEPVCPNYVEPLSLLE